MNKDNLLFKEIFIKSLICIKWPWIVHDYICQFPFSSSSVMQRHPEQWYPVQPWHFDGQWCKLLDFGNINLIYSTWISSLFFHCTLEVKRFLLIHICLMPSVLSYPVYIILYSSHLAEVPLLLVFCFLFQYHLFFHSSAFSHLRFLFKLSTQFESQSGLKCNV